MKRRLIKIGNSTLLLSVPREWVIANNLSKGDEVEITQDQDKLTLWCDSRITKEKLVIDVTDFKEVMARFIYATYRSGIDELDIKWHDPSIIDQIKSVIWKETVGYEILDQGKDSCRIVNVSGKIEDFPNIFRRLFLITLTMNEEMISAIKKKSGMKNVLYLEQENNRLTTMLIRSINKYGSFGFKKIGPLYHIVQELEKIGDQHKYLAQYFINRKEHYPTSPKVIKTFESTSLLLRLLYDIFYNFQPKKANEIKEMRNSIIKSVIGLYQQKLNESEIALLYQSLNITTRTFDLLSSVFILKV